MRGGRAEREISGLKGPVTLVAVIAVASALLGTVPASADPNLSEQATVPSDMPSALPSAAPTAVPPVSSQAEAVSGNWVGPWPSTPIPADQASSAMVSNAILQTTPMPTTPAAVSMVAKAQISLSPTRPQQLSTKTLATAGGRVASRVTTVPDGVETGAGVSSAGTKMVVTSDTSKLSAADKRAMVVNSPKLTRSLVPVNAAGQVADGLAFRSTFQRGEKVRLEGTVTPRAMRDGALLVVEKAQVAPDGAVGRFFRTHTITPGQDGKYSQAITVRQGLELLRHRLVTRQTTPSPDLDWAALKAKAKRVLAEEERRILEDIAADAKGELSAAEQKVMAKLQAAVTTKLASFVLANIYLVGTEMLTVNVVASQDRAVEMYLSGWPQDGCNPSTSSDPCTTNAFDITLDSGQTKTITYVAPTERNTLSFYGNDGWNSKNYFVNWSSATDANPCSGFTPTPSELMKPGTTWSIYLEGDLSMYGFLDSNSANVIWSDQWSKKQDRSEAPALGCGFEFDKAIGNWWDGVPGWVKVILQDVAVIGVSLATAGIGDAVVVAGAAAEAAGEVAAETGAEVAAEAAGEAAAEVAGEAAAEATDALDAIIEEANEDIEASIAEADEQVEAAAEDAADAAEAEVEADAEAEATEQWKELTEGSDELWVKKTGLSKYWKTVLGRIFSQVLTNLTEKALGVDPAGPMPFITDSMFDSLSGVVVV